MEKAYVKTAEEVLGYKKKKLKPWLSQKAWTLIDQRKAIKQNSIGARSERLRKRWQDAAIQREEKNTEKNTKRRKEIKDDGPKRLRKKPKMRPANSI